MRIFDLIKKLENDETFRFQKENEVVVLRIEKYNLMTKQVWSIQQEFTESGLDSFICPDDIIDQCFKQMLEDIRNANK